MRFRSRRGEAITMAATVLMMATMTTTEAKDVHSYARPDEVRVTHMDLILKPLFDEKVIDGVVALKVARPAGATGQATLRLDIRDLTITRVGSGKAGTGSEANKVGLTEAPYTIGRRDPILGSELAIDLPEGADRVVIEYRTSPEATGLQWLDPSQTAGKQHPFLFTQSQAIHARSWVPCQDSPGIRITYKATVEVPASLRAVMAARDTTPEKKKSDAQAATSTYSFQMQLAIPPYLLALAVGDLDFASTGTRTGVWAEPSVLKKAAWEFADMERMLAAAEKLYGPYRWGRYDLLVLPPSFPWGGMENPMLTFATPTILAGDRSLVALVAHEMAHSWSGNLVTNATWSDFWLNEGFTTYIERRMMEAVFGRERVEMEWMLGRQDLDEEIVGLADKPGDQMLRINLEGRDPDDGATDIAYEKGALMLRLLEESYGREPFDSFLREWFDGRAFSSVTTDQLLAVLDDRLFKRVSPATGKSAPDLPPWLTGPGVPPAAPSSRSDALRKVDASSAAWLAGKIAAGKIQTKEWTTHHWLHFLKTMPTDLGAARMAELDAAFGLTSTGNAEILDEWLVLSCRHGYAAADARLEEFLTGMGRRKYLRPIYEEMVKSEAGKKRALAIYAKARPLYHSVARQTIEKILGWEPAKP